MAEIVTAPGFFADTTKRGAKGRWTDGDNVRFRDIQPEKIGGCVRLTSTVFNGICRKMINFITLDLKPYIAMATNERFYIVDNSDLINVTPLRVATATLTDPFSTTATSSSVNVADTSHGVIVGDIVTFDDATPSPTDAITIDGDYTVTGVVDVDNYTIDSGTVATNTEAAFGGTVDYYYEISPGYVDAQVGDGYGAGPFNGETWGTPRTASDIWLPARTVSISPWGEDVMFNPRSGAIYRFDTSVGVVSSNRAAIIANAPDTALYILLSPEDRHLIALGAHNGSVDDPMLVMWCSQEDYTDWVPLATNTAGDKRLEVGTEILTGVYANKQMGIITDGAFYSMVFVGYPDTFSIRMVKDKCGGISPECAVSDPDGRTYWRGDFDFFMHDGDVHTLPCEIRDWVNANLNRTQKVKIQACLNSAFNECWWLMPGQDGNEISFCVVYNYKEQYFFYFSFSNWGAARTALVDAGFFGEKPIAAGDDGYLWQQETGTDHGEDELPAYIRRFADEIGEGSRFTNTNTLIPDFDQIEGSVDVTFTGKRYPQDPQEITKGPYNITDTTSKHNVRLRARQIEMLIESEGLGSHWRFGTLRLSTFERGAK
ncbi:MAG: hypothetical protein ACXWYM_00260 [Candidatus Binatia bacterium]